MISKPLLYIDIWLDVSCPFSYVQLPVLDMLADTYREKLEMRWHMLEVSPEPLPMFEPGEAGVLQAYEQIIFPLARERGITIRMPSIITRTRRALEALVFAKTQGRFVELMRALLRAYFERSANLSSINTLTEIAATCDLDAKALRRVLERGDFVAAVQADRDRADEIGVHGLPFVLVSRNGLEDTVSPPIAVHGVAPFDHYRAAVDQLYPVGFGKTAVHPSRVAG